MPGHAIKCDDNVRHQRLCLRRVSRRSRHERRRLTEQTVSRSPSDSVREWDCDTTREADVDSVTRVTRVTQKVISGL